MIVKLDQRAIGTCFFKGCWKQVVYENGKPTETQATDESGVPLWRVKAELTVDGKGLETIRVSVPVAKDPSLALSLNDQILFTGFRIESGERRTGGRWERLLADGIRKKVNGDAGKDEK